MVATLVQSGLFPPPSQINHRRVSMQNYKRRSPPFVLSVLADNNNNNNLDSSPSSTLTTTVSEPEKTVYNDNWFHRLAINHLSDALQSSAGYKSKNSGYEGLIEAATMASQRFTPMQQRDVVMKTLEAYPKPVLSLMKKLLPPSKLSREFFAAFTTVFFAWLVGPCEVRESEFEGRREKNVVHIPKCRFLEGTNCVGMCTNMCKMPSQAFIKEFVGVPVNMVPNFDDMSCEMIFGEEPPPQSLDPAFAQPCYKLCKATVKRNHRNCTD